MAAGSILKPSIVLLYPFPPIFPPSSSSPPVASLPQPSSVSLPLLCCSSYSGVHDVFKAKYLFTICVAINNTYKTHITHTHTINICNSTTHLLLTKTKKKQKNLIILVKNKRKKKGKTKINFGIVAIFVNKEQYFCKC